MERVIKANEEEEKRNGEINVAQLLPNPYIQVNIARSPYVQLTNNLF
jgi:hypothetical protein